MKIKTTILFAAFAFASTFPQSKHAYLNPKLPIQQRVDNLINSMTLKEKISQMVNDASAIKRLDVPKYDWWNECLHGVARNGLATVFPEPIGLASTWDKNLMHQVGNAISDEARAKYNFAIKNGERGKYQGLTFWAPNINIVRDPRWGRGMETYGEDPYLTGQLAVQFIKGLQGNNPKYLKIVATAKHFAVYNGPEPLRHRIDVNVSNYDLYETYLPAFKACVKDANVASIMCAYNSLRGNACCSNDPILNKILRNDWGFKGYVVSDCGAIADIYKNHKQTKDAEEASAKAVLAGTDLNCGVTLSRLGPAVKKGLISEALIDTSLKRLFTARFKLGMFDPPSMVPYSKINMSAVESPQHQELSLQSAKESIVLLRNADNILPLKKSIKSIAVIGPNANNKEVLYGNYNGFPSQTVTPLDGIKNNVRKHTKVFYALGCNIAEDVPSLKVIPSKYLFTSTSEKEHGLIGKYFNNYEFKGKPVFTRTDSAIDFDWLLGYPRKDFKINDFSVLWKGYLVPPVTGKYFFGLQAYENAKIFINDSLISKFPQKRGHSRVEKGIVLEAGKAYKIKIEYYENSHFGRMHLLWSVPDEHLEQEAINAAKRADVTVMFMGLSPRLEGEERNLHVPGFNGGDRETLNLPQSQENLIKKITALGRPVVLVLINGSALSINWENENIPGILESWYGGQAAGTAIADVLFGDYNPGGKLPVTFYKSVKQLPPFTDYDMKGRTYRYFTGPVLYPFGYGLSYTTFSFNNLKLSTDTIKEDGTCTLSVDVTNIGKVVGDEVAELYVKGRGTAENGAIKSLKGFERVHLLPGETKNVKFDISPKTLHTYINGIGYEVKKGEHTLMIGSSSKNSDLKEIKITVE